MTYAALGLRTVELVPLFRGSKHSSLWLAAALLLPCFAAGQPAEEAHVVLVSLDGFGAADLTDPRNELPELRALIGEGVWAEASESVFPSADHPGHTSLITGVPPRIHGVIGNRLLNRETKDYFHITNKPRTQSVRVPTVFDAAKRRGLRTASFYWPETRDDPSIDRNIPQVLDGAARPDPGAAGAGLLDELRGAGVPIDVFYESYDDPARLPVADSVLTEAAAYVLRTYRPHLLAIRLSVVDRTFHRHGREDERSRAALAAADRSVSVLRRAARDAGIGARTAFFVVSDHGFHTVHYAVNVFPWFEEAGLREKVGLYPLYWSVFVELTGSFDPKKDKGTLERVLQRIAASDGIGRVVAPDEFHDLGFPRYEEDPHVLGHYIIFGDADTRPVVDETGNLSTRRTRLPGPFHGHGHLPTQPAMYPLFVAAGHGLKTGVRMGRIHNVDVAPTIAHLLGLEMTGTTGRVLSEALSSPGEPR
jgi:predicted AlkP superfamily pyrophosphatase or phosphodiesterase